MREEVVSVERRINSFMERLDTFLSSTATEPRDVKTSLLVNEDLRRQETALRVDAAEFVASFSKYIVNNSSESFSNPDASSLSRRLVDLDPFMAAELLLAIKFANDASPLAKREFMANLDSLDPYVGYGLLYEIRLTGNSTDLTDRRIFQNTSASFFNELGAEAASEWFNSIGSTRNISALTSAAALSTDVLNTVKENAALTSELSYAIGKTDALERLTDSKFLSLLSGMDSALATEYLSAIWATKRVDDLASKSMARRVGSGEVDIWRDVVRLFNSNELNSETIIISMAGEGGHDRGAKLTIEALLSSGFNTIYVGNAQSPKQLIDIALEENAQAIGFSINWDSNHNIITSTMAQARLMGLDGISFFGGGIINPQIAGVLEARGTKLFAPGASQGDLVGFLKSPQALPSPQTFAESFLSASYFRSPSNMGAYSSATSGSADWSSGGAAGAYSSVNRSSNSVTRPFLMEALMRFSSAPVTPFPFIASSIGAYPIQVLIGPLQNYVAASKATSTTAEVLPTTSRYSVNGPDIVAAVSGSLALVEMASMGKNQGNATVKEAITLSRGGLGMLQVMLSRALVSSQDAPPSTAQKTRAQAAVPMLPAQSWSRSANIASSLDAYISLHLSATRPQKMVTTADVPIKSSNSIMLSMPNPRTEQSEIQQARSMGILADSKSKESELTGGSGIAPPGSYYYSVSGASVAMISGAQRNPLGFLERMIVFISEKVTYLVRALI